MRTYKVARMTTGGCSEKHVHFEDMDNDSDTGISECTQRSDNQQEEEMGRNPRKRLRSSVTSTQSQSFSVVLQNVVHSSGPNGKAEISIEEQASSLNAFMDQIKESFGTSLEQLKRKIDEEHANSLKEEKEKWAAEKACLEKHPMDETALKQNLETKVLDWEKKVVNMERKLREAWEYINGRTAASGEWNTDGNQLCMSIDDVLSSK